MQSAVNANGTVSLTILVRPEPAGQHTAQVVGLPEFRATAATAEAAAGEVQRLLNESLAQARWVQVAVPAAAAENPLLQFAGHARDDPGFEEYLEEIRRFRQEVDEQARKEDEAG